MGNYTKDFLIRMAEDAIKNGNLNNYSEAFKGLANTVEIEFIIDNKRQVLSIGSALAKKIGGSDVKVVSDMKNSKVTKVPEKIEEPIIDNVIKDLDEEIETIIVENLDDEIIEEVLEIKDTTSSIKD